MRPGQFDGCSGEPIEQDPERLISRSGGQNPDTSDIKAWTRAGRCGQISFNGDSWHHCNTAHQAGITSNCWIQWASMSPDLSPTEPLGGSGVDTHTANRAAVLLRAVSIATSVVVKVAATYILSRVHGIRIDQDIWSFRATQNQG